MSARDSRGRLGPCLAEAGTCADVLLLAGDLTRAGEPEEAAILVDELDGIGVPVVSVLGNHDLHSDRQDDVVVVLRGGGIDVLEGGHRGRPGRRRHPGRGRRDRVRRRVRGALRERLRRA